MKKIWVFTLFLIGIIIVIGLSAKIYASFQYRSDIKKLFHLSENSEQDFFTYSRLDSLPGPVRDYFKHVLKEGQPYVRYVRLKHGGQFRTSPDKDWMPIEGEEYFTTDNPGFLWRGQTTFFTAHDMYISGKGQLKVSLISFIPILHVEGPNYNQGELLRWFGESVWFPTNLLPNERIHWNPIDSTSANMYFTYLDDSLHFKVTFNKQNEITQLETKRFMDAGRLETWIIKLSDYQEMNDILIPVKAEVLWRLDSGDFSYARFMIHAIEYDNPVMF